MICEDNLQPQTVNQPVRKLRKRAWFRGATAAIQWYTRNLVRIYAKIL